MSAAVAPAGLAKALPHSVDLRQQANQVKQIFKEVHSDPAGALTFLQVKTLLARCTPKGALGFTEADVRVLFDAADKSRNGKIEFDQFMDFLMEEEPVSVTLPAPAPVPTQDPPPLLDDKALEDVVAELRRNIGADKTKVVIVIIGSTSFSCEDTEELIRIAGRALAETMPPASAVFVTGGMLGVQKLFSESYGDAQNLWHLAPEGLPCGFAQGTELSAGSNMPQKQQIVGCIGDLYLSFEGGPGVAKEARLAAARDAVILPLQRTGGASGGMFDFPAAAFERPARVEEELWALLSRKEVPVPDAAAALAKIVVQLVCAR